MVTEYHPASVIWTQLIEVLQTKQTGTFFIATAENSSGRFAVQNGRITHCAYQRLHGEEAVQALVNLVAGRCSFMPKQGTPFRERDQVEHLHAIQLLNLLPPPQSLVQPLPIPVDKSVEVISSTEKLADKTAVNNRFYRGYVPIEESK